MASARGSRPSRRSNGLAIKAKEAQKPAFSKAAHPRQVYTCQ
jgi:hypothetical protein